MESSLHLILRLAALDDFGQRTELVFENPQLLNPQIQAALHEELQTLSSQEREILQGVLLTLFSIRNRLESGEARYPFGTGPIEPIWTQQGNGEINDSQANALAARLGSENRLSPVYCENLSGYLVDLAHSGQWQTALQRARLLMAAIQALPAGEAELISYANSVLDWIEIAKEALVQLGDRRIYQQARKIGEALVRQATLSNSDLLRGAALHRLGILSLDPYRAGRSSTSYASTIELWRRRLANDYPSVLEESPENEWLMPEPMEGLLLAEALLRQAVGFRQGHEKGLTLKALVNDLDWRRGVLQDATVQVDEIVQTAIDAMDALDADEDPAAMLDMIETLDRYHAPIPQRHTKQIESLLSIKTPADHAHQVGDRRAVDRALWAAQLLAREQPAEAIQLVQGTQSLIRHLGNEELLVTAWNLEFRLIMRLYAGDFEISQPTDSLQDILQELRRRSDERQWSQSTMGAHLLHLVIAAAERDQEVFGLQILDQIDQLAPEILQKHPEAILNKRSRLLANLGAEDYNQGAHGNSAAAYIQAIQLLLQLGLANRSLDLLTHLSDVVGSSDPPTAANLVYQLQQVALELERMIGPAATRLLQQMYRQINSQLFALGQDEVSTIAINDLYQLAKGLRFAASLEEDNRSDPRSDPYSASLLRRISEVESTLAPESGSTTLEGVQSLLADLALTAYDQEQEQSTGRDSKQRLHNLQNSFDTHLNNQLLSQAGTEVSYVTNDQIIKALDARTVLINYYLAQTADADRVAINLLVFTDQSITAVHIPTGIENKWAGVGTEPQLLVPPLGLEIFSLRGFITQYPAFPGHPVSKQAAEWLEFSQRLFFGHFFDELGKLRAQGKDHLCIIPHGPLHYFPFHLIKGPDGKPLAEDWIITYLPHIKLLTARVPQAAPPARNASPVAMGISFQQFNLFQQEPLPQSISETEAVASIFGTPHVLEREATRGRLVAALQSAPYVHLSTHGTHNSYAPAFQCLYLAPEATSDGRFFAYELIGLDLRGLEVLTLSACESVLGRFDPADNLRGIPAYLLMGGLKTLIGTLWEAQAEPAERFFTTFYKELLGGRSRLDAFAHAQRAARQEFPEYDAWGPFCYIGDWQQ
ncbi:MAG TPA: CHAT domain-containing protein [Thermoanaerobaculia bacterium]|nr:CHAT domain-containing protein [Thermoanaerobaculia bacterium]